MEAIKRTWWLFAIIFLLWVFYPFMISSDLIKVWKPWMDWSLRGQLGDSFGALNTLFSGLALAGLGVNIYLQGVQLKKLEEKEQQNEDQLKAQAEALRLTALLNYYTSEYGRFTSHIVDGQQLAKKYSGNEQERLKAFIDQLFSDRKTISEKRDEIVKRLEEVELR